MTGTRIIVYMLGYLLALFGGYTAAALWYNYIYSPNLFLGFISTAGLAITVLAVGLGVFELRRWALAFTNTTTSKLE